MNRNIFETSAETIKLVGFFVQLPMNTEVTFDSASTAVGFPVSSTLPAYISAKRIAERDHGAVIVAVRGSGFIRVDGFGMAKSMDGGFMRMWRAGKRVTARGLLALSQNLDPSVAREVSAKITRSELVVSTSAPHRSRSNRIVVPTVKTVVTNHIGRLAEVK
jgi:hypothetical protein